MAWDRNERTEALLREKVAIIVLERLNDPRLGFVTITGAKLSRDKCHCRVLFTVLGTPTQRRLSERALQDAAPHIQRVLGKSMRLRTLPELRFAYDESIAKEARMLDILDQLAGPKPEDAPPGAEPQGPRA
jgi:ribosome-binding factor A